MLFRSITMQAQVPNISEQADIQNAIVELQQTDLLGYAHYSIYSAGDTFSVTLWKVETDLSFARTIAYISAAIWNSLGKFMALDFRGWGVSTESRRYSFSVTQEHYNALLNRRKEEVYLKFEDAMSIYPATLHLVDNAWFALMAAKASGGRVYAGDSEGTFYLQSRDTWPTDDLSYFAVLYGASWLDKPPVILQATKMTITF